MKIYRLIFFNTVFSLLLLLCIFTTKTYAISSVEDILQGSSTDRLNILNPVSHPKTGDTWEIQFTTEGIDDLFISLEDKETVEDIEYRGLYCKGIKEYYPMVLTESISMIKGYHCEGISVLRYLVNTAGDHTVAIQYGEEKEIAHNSGIFQWAERLGSNNLNDHGSSIITDSMDNIIISGYVIGYTDLNGDGDKTDGGAESSSGYGDYDIVISVFNSSRVHQWSKRLGGTGHDFKPSITTDSSGNIIVTGQVSGNADLNGDGDSTDGGAEDSTGYGSYDIFISVFNSSGTHQWAKRLGGSSYDYGNSVTTDSTNNVIVVGVISGNADLNGDGDATDGGSEDSTGYEYYDIFISVFNSSGTYQWAKRLGGIYDDYGYSVITDTSDNIIVTGYVWGNADLNGDRDSTDGGAEDSTGYGISDIFMTVFNSSGIYQWSKRMGGTDSDSGKSVTTDSANNIIVTGVVYENADLNGDGDSTDGGAESSTGYGGDDIFISVFNSSGAYQWSKRMGGISGDDGCSVTIDTSNNIIITGKVYNNGDLNGDGDSTDGGAEDSTGYGDMDIFISVFNSSGTYQWSERLGGINVDSGYSVSTDSSNNIIIAGDIRGYADLNGDGDSTDGGAESSIGYGGSDIFISIFAPDIVAPSLITSSPTSTSLVNDPTLTITLTLDDQGDCRLSLSDETYDNMSDDIDCSGDGTPTISCTTLDLGEDGVKNVYVSCRDTSGNKNTSATNFDLVYTLDTVLPIPSSFSPSSGSTITTNFPTITFSLDEDGDCRASTTDESYADMGDNTDCSGDGTQSISCDMSNIGLNGQKTIYISCEDMLPNQDTIGSNEELVYTLLEIDPPQKGDFFPEEESLLNTPTPIIEFQTDENATCRLSLTDESYDQMVNDVECDGSETTYQSCTSPDLGTFGDKVIYISCTDCNGNKDTSTSNVELEYTFIPMSSITGPILEFPEVDGYIYAMALSEDESILYIGGDFSQVGDMSEGGTVYERYNLAAIDTQTYEVLDWNLIPTNTVRTIEVFNDSIYIGGSFPSIYNIDTEEETYTGGFAKINSDGTLNTNCMPDIHSGGGEVMTVYSVKATDEHIYVGGSFNYIGENDTGGIVRLENSSSCTWDNTWTPEVYDPVYTIDTYGDDIYIGGSFGYIGETYTGEFAKINSDGTLNTNCMPDIHSGGGEVMTVYSVKATDEHIYVGGSFNYIGENDTGGIVRLENSSSCTWDSSWAPYYFVDEDYDPATIYTIDTYGDNVFVGGSLARMYNYEIEEETYTGEFVKLNSSGILDTDFLPDVHTLVESTVYSSVVGSNNIFVGGSFNMVGEEDVFGLTAFGIDSTPPSGNVSINLGNTYSVSPNVNLSLSATDSSGVREMVVCNDLSFTGCTWETYKTTKSWVFDSTYGIKTVYVKFKDNAGNISDIYSDSIVLHTPSARITDIGEITDIPDKTPLTYYFTSQYPVIKGVSQSGSTVYFVYDGKTYTTVANSSGNFSISLTVPMGSNTIQYYSKDVSDNQSLTRTLNLIVGSSYFPNWLLEKLGLITTEEEEEETPEQESQQEDTPDTPDNEEEEDSQGDVQVLRFTDKDGKPLVNAFVEIEGVEYYTDSDGEIRVVGLEEGKNYKIKVEHDGVKYKTEVLGASGVDGSIQVQITEQDISDGIDWKKISIYSGIGLLIIFFLILIFRRRKDKEEENNSLNIH